MTLRPAIEEDLPRIVEIYNSSIPTRESTADLIPVSVEARRSWFRRHRRTRPIFVYEMESAIAAWFSFEDFYGRDGYARTSELSLYVAPESRGQGIGTELLDRALEIAGDIGIRSVVGYVFGHNTASLRLLKSAAFEEWGRMPRIAEMDGQEYDVVIMGKRLAQVTPDLD